MPDIGLDFSGWPSLIGARTDPAAGIYENIRRAPIIHAAALVSLAIYGAFAFSGDLRERLPWFLAGHAVLLALMFLGWRQLRGPGRPGISLVLWAALAFRIVAAFGEPALSDDVYRYVWDGRVQLAGHHPYDRAPAAPALSHLRDESWSRINHPELKTIYPPLSQLFFLLLAATGGGPVVFKLALGLVDFGVVLALARLLERLGRPADRLVLYAWNPLAVMETAGSGHVEPLGVLLVLLALLAIAGKRVRLAPLCLAGAVHAKLFPLALIPGFVRRLSHAQRLVLVLVLVGVALPYLLTGPLVPAGLFDYAERWERNAFVFAGVRQAMEWIDTGPPLTRFLESLQGRWGDWPVPWGTLYRHVWPPAVARAVVLLLGLSWVVWLARRPQGAARETLLVFAGLLLLSPTVHPWYVLWLLPLAAALLSPGWLWFAALVPISYVGIADVPWSLRCIEYVPAIGLMAWSAVRSLRRPPVIDPA